MNQSSDLEPNKKTGEFILFLTLKSFISSQKYHLNGQINLSIISIIFQWKNQKFSTKNIRNLILLLLSSGSFDWSHALILIYSFTKIILFHGVFSNFLNHQKWSRCIKATYTWINRISNSCHPRSLSRICLPGHYIRKPSALVDTRSYFEFCKKVRVEQSYQ